MGFLPSAPSARLLKQMLFRRHLFYSILASVLQRLHFRLLSAECPIVLHHRVFYMAHLHLSSGYTGADLVQILVDKPHVQLHHFNFC